MNDKMTKEEFERLSPEQRAAFAHNQSKARFSKIPMCPRRSVAHVVIAQVVEPALVTVQGESRASSQPLPFDALVQCMEEACALWDHKKGRCLERSAFIAQAYGKDESGKRES